VVERLLPLRKQLRGVKTGHENRAILRQIDQLVYELYELSDEEIGIVEEATGR